MTRITILLVFIFLSTASVMAQDAATLHKKHFNLVDGVAIQGYDPVSYFKQGKAVKGKKDQAFVDAGVTYYFSSPENKEEYKKNPARYAPEYGGWCAYAMGANGEKVNIDPGTFKIVNNKLYLFYNKFFNNTLKDWNKDEANLKSKADANWQKTIH